MRIVCLGDSLTFGYPYDKNQSWTTGLAKALNLEITNVGVNGDTTADMLARFEEDVIAAAPTHLVIMGGTNDAYIGVGIDEIKHNYQRLIDMCQQSSIIPILCLMPPVADSSESRLKEIREHLTRLAAEKGFFLIDFYSIFLDENGTLNKELFCDDCHPNLAGYQKMTDCVVGFFSKIFKITPN